MPCVTSRRLLLVHAHPDDESITTGATMAYYVANGAQVTLLTCTLGEEGEVLAPEYAQLEAAQADQLGGLRIWELDSAMRALGVIPRSPPNGRALDWGDAHDGSMLDARGR